MPLPITPPVDAEAVVIAYLTPALPPGFPIDVRGGGGQFVRVRRIGGTEHSPNHDEPAIDVLVWHDDDHARMQLALTLWARLRGANNDPAGDGVLTYTSTTQGPRQMPDPADDTKTVCLLTVQLLVRPAS